MTRGLELFTEDLSLWPQLRRLEPDLFARLERFFFFDDECESGILWTRDKRAYYMYTFLNNSIAVTEVPQWDNGIHVTCIKPDLLEASLIMVLTKSHLVWCSILTTSTRPPELSKPTLFAFKIQKLSRGSAADTFAHLLALDLNGGVWTWGDNSYGQLGLGHREPMRAICFSRVESLIGKRIVDIQAENKTSLAFTDRNEIYLWGKVGESTEWTLPRRISTPPHVISYGLVGTMVSVEIDGTTLFGKHYRNLGPFFRDTWQENCCSEKIVKVHHLEENNDNQCLAFETHSGHFISKFHVEVGISPPESSMIDSVRYDTTFGIVTLTESARRQVCLFNDPQSSDLTIRVGKEIFVHRNVIQSKSPFLAMLLPEDPSEVLALDHFYYEAIYSYLRFLYSDKSTDLQHPFILLGFATNDPNLRQRLICLITQRIIYFYRRLGWHSVSLYLWSNRSDLAVPIYDQQRTQPDDTLSARIVRYLFQNIHFDDEDDDDEDEEEDFM